MQIRPEQADSSHLLDQEGFIARLCQEVVDESPWLKRTWPTQLILERVCYAYDRATIANGLMRDVDIRTYVQLFFDTSASFDQQPAIAEILHDSTLQPDEKWDILSAPDFAPHWDSLKIAEEELFPEEKGRIEDAYPTTYRIPGFQELYAKVRKEEYPFLADGESLDEE